MRDTQKSIRCLGIDPGIKSTGWGVVVKTTRGYKRVSDGLIATDSNLPTGDRLLTIYQSLCERISTELPEKIGIERCFHNRNVSSSESTSAVIGIVEMAAAQFGIEVVKLTPQAVKSSTGLGGAAGKRAVQKMMCKIFRRESLNHHVADAGACAVAGVLS